MEVTPLIAPERQLIQSYGEGGFKITGIRHEGSILVLPERTEAWPVADLGQAPPDSLGPILAHEPPVEILLIGAGGRFARLPRGLRDGLKARLPRLSIETMDTPAACRTYNVLLAEDRRVAAALIAV
ncbi:Mth938-like domain-containing protein [Marinivivus vitaminiproducens]|uniref:Mth938-like domain-containing protein n=1 Tax=Marinivivus vitaminiproducens TaxID=3035935 RepID=UPI0027A93DB9|nr:Mth938-like domain-containing protein [Geminicoccaceae bacterium SCSIO 64248]